MSEINIGDLVMCLASQHPLTNEHIGKIAVAVSLYEDAFWELDPPTISSTGVEMTWAPQHLRRIDPPATGEYDGVPVRLDVPVKEAV